MLATVPAVGRIGGAVLALAIVIAAAGCGGSDNDPTNSGAATTAASASSDGTTDGSTGGSTDGSSDGSSDGAESLQAGRAIAYTADIAVETDDVGDAVRRACDIALSNGGLLFDESVVLGDPAEGRATLKVPPDRLSSTLDGLGAVWER